MQSRYFGIQKTILTPRAIALSTVVATALVAVAACSDAGEGDLTTSGTSTSTTSASVTTSTTSGATTASATTGSTTGATTSSSSGTGGGGQGGAGGAGGCIDPATAASVFTIQTAELCVVASYTAPDLTLAPYGVQPTWGRHNGPLTSNVDETTSDITIDRWGISGSTLAKTETVISGVTQIPTGSYGGAQAIDLPFSTLTAVSWTGSSFTTDGGFVFADATHVTSNYVATGAFGMAVVGPAVSARVLYTGLSAFNGPTNDTPALYAADFTNGTLGTSQAISTWGESNGPVAVDSAGNAIVINTKFSDGTQEIRGFAASTIVEGQSPTLGQTLLTTDGFGSALAAIAPKQRLSGLMIYQPQTGLNGDYADVIVLRYNVSGNTVSAVSHETILALTTANTNLTLMTDTQDRIWVGAPAATGSVFYVLARP